MTDIKQEAWDATPVAHRQTLLGERRAGSTWGRPFTFEDWQQLLPRWTPLHPGEGIEMPGCRYFSATIADLFPAATLGALAWGDLSEDEQSRVVTREGAHGPELELPVERDAARPRATIATLILGMHEGAQVVFTVHPGAPLRPGVERAALSAVKLVAR